MNQHNKEQGHTTPKTTPQQGQEGGHRKEGQEQDGGTKRQGLGQEQDGGSTRQGQQQEGGKNR